MEKLYNIPQITAEPGPKPVSTIQGERRGDHSLKKNHGKHQLAYENIKIRLFCVNLGFSYALRWPIKVYISLKFSGGSTPNPFRGYTL